MNKWLLLRFAFILLLPAALKAQPFIDLANFNYQEFRSTYTDSVNSKSRICNYNLMVSVPKVFKNENTLVLRAGGERLTSSIGASHYTLYALSVPVGFQFVNRSKKWKMLLMAIPKLATDGKEAGSKNRQLGGTVLFTHVFHDSLKVKFGLYYNRECFGNFFVPLVGIDWKATKRISVYGILPNNLRVEYDFGFLYAGIGYKNFQRSYRLFSGFDNDFVRVRESQVKVFVEGFPLRKQAKHLLVFAEVGYTLKYSFIQYDEMNKKEAHLDHAVYTPVRNNFVLTAGMAYRIRLD